MTRSDEGPTIVAHEFDYSVKNQVVYHEKGVKITSTPVDHYHTPGAVAYRLEWNGITVTYSGDCGPCSFAYPLCLVLISSRLPAAGQGWSIQENRCIHIGHIYSMCSDAGDTVPIDSLRDLAELGSGTDVLLLESVGPIEDMLTLPYDTQYLLNVRTGFGSMYEASSYYKNTVGLWAVT